MNEYPQPSIYKLGEAHSSNAANRITKAEISELVHKSRAMSYTEVQALNRIFGPELSRLQKVGADKNETNLFLPLLSHIFDKRTLGDVECVIPPHGQEKKKVILKEKAVPIHTRSSFISKILEERDGHNSPTISIARVDLLRFREADFDVGGKNGIRPADVIINTTARVIREALKEKLGKKVAEKACSYEVGRYGGDELVIAFIGDISNEERAQVMERIYAKLKSEKGYYKNKDTGDIEQAGINFKEDPKLKEKGQTDLKAEWIHFPEDVDEHVSVMYKEYLNRGLILNDEDFSRERAKYTKGDGAFDFDRYRADYPESKSIVTYPKGLETTEAKISYLLDRHPELSPYFHLAQTFDKEQEFKRRLSNIKTSLSEGAYRHKRNTPPVTTRQKELLKIVEKSIFDRLLGDMIYSRPHFIEHMDKNEINELHVIDFKFLKEINTAMTYADSDNNIKALYKKIQEAIPVEEHKNIIISRFAGAIFIGVKKGASLSQKTQDDLSKIQTLSTGETGNIHDVPLGNAYIDLTAEGNTSLTSHEAINKLEAKANNVYYTNLVRDILLEEKKSGDFIFNIMNINLDQLADRPYQSLSKSELYALSLRGQRRTARIQNLVDATCTQDEFVTNKEYLTLIQKLTSVLNNHSQS